jgi:hypothetical protein
VRMPGKSQETISCDASQHNPRACHIPWMWHFRVHAWDQTVMACRPVPRVSCTSFVAQGHSKQLLQDIMDV